MANTSETEAIFSSTGSLGVSRRQYDRLYVNATRYSDDFEEVARNTRRVSNLVEAYPQRISRGVLRGVVSRQVMDGISCNGLNDVLEVALPLKEFTGDDSHLIYLSRNAQGRTQIVPIHEMIGLTSGEVTKGRTPVERVEKVLNSGLALTKVISEDQIDQLHSLWSPTFGWEYHEVEALQKRVSSAQNLPPEKKSERDVWFAAITDNGTIVSAAMAERLPIPGNGQVVDLIESTEWKTREEYSGQGLMTATLALLNAQVLADLRGNSGKIPLVYAECNFQSRSDRAGIGAGFRIPDRNHAPQILVQNVLVNDGQDIPEGKLRDFTFMYLPIGIIEDSYHPSQTEAIIQAVRA